MEITAVKYLVKEFSDILGKINLSGMQELLLMDAIKQAKQKEKQQIIDAFEQGSLSEYYKGMAERFYDKTYGKANQ